MFEALPPLKDVIAQYDLQAQKALGQNFLLDQNITDKIVRLAGDLTGHTVLEIGPGPGGLTRSLLKSGAKKVIALEFDARAVRALEGLKTLAGERLEIIQGDALKTDLLCLAPAAPRAIIANLPYNIATPLIIGWLRQIRDNPDTYSTMSLMVQKEVGERLTAVPGNKVYGRLSVLAGWLCDVRIVYRLPPSAFMPPPKVSSCVVQFTPKKRGGDQPDFDALGRVTEAAFGQRRKMIRTSLKNYAAKIEALGLDPTKRAENLSIENYIQLATLLKHDIN